METPRARETGDERDSARRKARDAQLRYAISRLRETERRIERLENTVKGLAREAGGVSIGSPCAECSESRLIVKRGSMYCPQCGYRCTM